MKLGVCYYPEHWPEEMWAGDAARMAGLGLSLVRIGEFAWSRIEPEPGEYNWAWLDRAIETLAGAGLQIIMGTPTATPPKWLVDAYPDVLPCDAHGRPRRFGSRRHYCFSSETYRRESARIVAAMAERYGAHPAIVMWQTDNEFGCHDTVESFSGDARAAFRLWLKGRYKTVDALNAAWGTVFWSMAYRSFDEIDPPMATVTEPHPAHMLDWRRFSSDQVADYNRVQTAIIRKHASGRPITHNFMGHFNQFDHFKLAQDLDLATWDSYPLGFLEMAWWDKETKVCHARTGHPDFAAFHHDLYRGLCNGRWGIMEQQPGPVNWAHFNPAPEPGMVALWTLEAAAHGAEFVSYFRWRQAPFAQEQMHAGLNRPDNVPDVASTEAKQALDTLSALGVLPDTKQAPVALIYDYESQWTHKIQPQGRSFHYEELAFAMYSAARRAGLNIDIVGPDQDLAGYDIVLVPSLPMADSAFTDRLSASGAEILIGPRSGSRTPHFQISDKLAPGALRALLDIQIPRVESLTNGLALSGTYGDMHFQATRWREFVDTDLEPLASLADGEGALFAQGKARYLAIWPDAALMDALISNMAGAAGRGTIDLPKGVRTRCRGELVFVMNYGPEALDAAQLDRLMPDKERLIGKGRLAVGGVAVFKPRV